MVPGVHEQVIGRVARDGQKSPVVAYFPDVGERVRPVIIDALGIKRQQVEGIRNPTSTPGAARTDGGHARRPAERYLHQIGRKVTESASVAGIACRIGAPAEDTAHVEQTAASANTSIEWTDRPGERRRGGPCRLYTGPQA